MCFYSRGQEFVVKRRVRHHSIHSYHLLMVKIGFPTSYFNVNPRKELFWWFVGVGGLTVTGSVEISGNGLLAMSGNFISHRGRINMPLQVSIFDTNRRIIGNPF